MNDLTFEQLFFLASLILALVLLLDILILLKILLKKTVFKNRSIDLDISESCKCKKITEKLIINHITKIRNKIELKIDDLRRFQIIDIQCALIYFLWRKKNLLLNIVTILFSITVLYNIFKPHPRVKCSNPSEGSDWVNYEQPIEVIFKSPFRSDEVEPHIAPDIKGEWKYDKMWNWLPFTRKVQFYPEESLPPETPIIIYLSKVSKVIGEKEEGEHQVKFTTAPLPNVVSISTEDTPKDVPVNEDIVIDLDLPDGLFVEWEFKFTPEADFTIIRSSDTKIDLRFNKKLNQGTDYQLDIYRTPTVYNINTKERTIRGEKEKIKALKFTTVEAPLIESFEPTGTNILPEQNIKVVFKQDMDKESVEKRFSINPDTSGDFSWDDSKTLNFKPQELNKNTTYEITLQKGLISQIGGISEEDVKYSFTTIGPVKVAWFNPGSGTGGVSINSQILVGFDQAVDHESAQNHFQLSPNINGSFSWDGNTMIYNLSRAMAHQTTYTATVTSGIKTVYGLDSISDFSTSFTTESQVFQLDLPQIYQTHTFTCNVTAARMTLAYRGFSVSDEQLVSHFGFDPTPRDTANNTWGNPHQQFVGNFESGYGVYWGPISSAISAYTPAQAHTGWNLTDMLKEVQNGNPVIIWGQNGFSSAYDMSWTTPTGTYIYAVHGMHSEVVKGYIGSPENPSYILLNDPWRGHRQYETSYFLGLWGYFNNSAVVVY